MSVITASIAALLMLAAVAVAGPTGGHPGKTTICHHTSSETNPWVQITVSNASLKAHHNNHGDIIPAPAEGCPSGGDDGGGGDIPT
jgi:ABC-type sugar transport system substrate-binding protein